MARITGTFYSNTGGHGRITNSNSNWTTLRNLTTGTGSLNQGLVYTLYGAPTYYLYRCFLPFNTSAIPNSATIVSWSVSLYRDDSILTFANANTTTLELLPSTQVDPTSLSTNDFDNLSYSSKGSLAFASTSNGAYNVITGTDLTSITKEGYTKLALTTGRDLNNSAPTGDNIFCYQAVGAANPPKMTVVYDIPDGGFPMFFGGGVTLG